MAKKSFVPTQASDFYLTTFRWVSAADLAFIALWVLYSLFNLTRAINFSPINYLSSFALSSTLPYLVLLPMLYVFRQKTLDGTLVFGIWHKVITWLLVIGLLGFGLFAFSYTALTFFYEW